MRRTMGFALMVAFLSLGAISGCGNSNDDNDLFGSLGSSGSDGADGSDGFMGADETPPAVPAAIWPDIQTIVGFLPSEASGKTQPLKVQYWDHTYFWEEDASGEGGSCFRGTVGIETSANIEQYVAAGNTCPPPSPFGTSQVTVCNPDVGPDANGDSASAGGAVQPGPRQPNCSGIVGANACKDIPVPDVTTETQCHESVYTLAPLAAGTVWFQNYDGSPTKGGSASHYWYGTRATSSFDPKDTYGGTLVDYITDATNLNIAASGGGSDEGGVNNIYLCKAVNVEDPANNPDCTLSSLFGNCDGQKLSECKLNNITPEKGAYNVYITSAKPTSALDGLDGAKPGADYWQPATWTIESFGTDPGPGAVTTGTDPGWNLCNGVGKLLACGQKQLGQPLWSVIQACLKQPECIKSPENTTGGNPLYTCIEPKGNTAAYSRFDEIWDVNAVYPMVVDGPEQMLQCRSKTHGMPNSKYPAIPNAEAKFEWFVDKFIDQKNNYKGQLLCVPGPAGNKITVAAAVGHGTGTCGQLQLFKNPRNGEILAQMQGDTRSWSFESSGEYEGNGINGGFCGETYPAQGCSGAKQETSDKLGNICIIPQISRVFKIQGNSASDFSLPEDWTIGKCL